MKIDGGTEPVEQTGPIPFESVVVVYAVAQEDALREARKLGLEPQSTSSCCFRDEESIYWVFDRPRREVFTRKVAPGVWVVCDGDMAIERGARWIAKKDTEPCPHLVERLAALEFATIDDALSRDVAPSTSWVPPDVHTALRKANPNAGVSKAPLPTTVPSTAKHTQAATDAKSAVKARDLEPAKKRDKASLKAALDKESPLRPDEITEASKDHFQRGDSVEIARRYFADHGIVIKKQAKNIGQGRFVCDNGTLYGYDARIGCWKEIVDERVQLHIMDYAGCTKGSQDNPKILSLDQSKIRQAVETVKVHVTQRGFFSEPRLGLCFRNGFVGLEDERVAMMPHGPENRQLTALDVDYDPDAKAPLFEQFLQDVFPLSSFQHCEDPLVQQTRTIECVGEFIGSCLFGLATRYQRALFLTGTGSNGKSVLLTIVNALFPHEMVLSLPPHEWEEKFALASLFGKRVNIVTETPKRELFDTEKFKAVISGDEITTDRKNRDMMSFRPQAGHLFAANELPSVSDSSHGFWRRVLIAPMNRVFAEHEQDPLLGKKIVQQELAGVAAWAIRGTQRLIARSGYDDVQASKSAVESWREQSDTVRLFMKECCERVVDPDEYQSAQKVYAAYRVWCQRNGHRHIVASNTMGRRMRDADVPIEHTRSGNTYGVKLLPGVPTGEFSGD